MAEKSVVVTSGTTRATVVSPGEITKVARVVVGRPVRRVSNDAGQLNRLQDVDISARTEGSVLVYKSSTSKWTATLDLDQQNVNGGSY